MKRKSVMVIVCLLIVLTCSVLFVGCGERMKEVSNKGVTITLPSDFKETEVADYDSCWSRDDAFVVASRMKKTEAAKNNARNLETYTNKVLVAANKTNVESYTKTDDLGNVEYYYAYYSENSGDGTYLLYMMLTKEGADHFYTIDFVCNGDKYENNYDAKFGVWADSIRVK